MLEFVNEHRLTGRLIDRCQGAPGVDSLLDALCVSQADTARRLSTAIGDLARATHGLAEPPVYILKGPTAHILSGDAAHVRASRDLDLWTPRPKALADHLLHNGGTIGWPVLAQHEVASICLSGMKLDVHDYIPTARYPDTAIVPSLDELMRAGTQLTDPCRIGALDLHALARAGFVRGSLPEPLVVFGATASTLIACTALSTDLAWEPLAPKSARLVPLFEIYEMSSLPGFDPDLFARLAADAGLETNVRMCARAVQAYFPPGPLDAFSDGETVLVQKLPNAGYGPWVLRDIDDVFLTGPRSVYDAIEGFATTVHSPSTGDIEPREERTLRWSSTRDRPPPIALHVAAERDRIILRVTGETGDLINVMMMFENGQFADVVLFKDRPPEVFRNLGTEHDYSVEPGRVSLSVARGTLDGGLVRGLAVVGGGSNDRDSFWSHVVPLRVVA